MSQQSKRERTGLDLFNHMLDVEMRFMQASARDAAMLSAAFHSEVIIHQSKSLPYGGDWHGLEGLAAMLGKMGEVWSDMRMDNIQVALAGDTLFVKATMHLTSRANGAAINQPFAEVLRFKDGLLIDGTPFYFDTGEIVAMLGQ